MSKTFGLLLPIVLFAILAPLQAVLAMYKFKEELSCDLETGFYEEILLLTVVLTIVYGIGVWLITRLKSLRFSFGVQTTWAVLLWFYQDLCIFQDRVACWSTFSFSEALNYTLSYSFIPLIVAAGCLFFLYQRIQNRKAVS